MKKQILSLSLMILTAGTLIFTGCSKDDTTGPVVTVTGDATQTIDLHGSYTEGGATAKDDEDGTTTVVTSGTVDKDKAGTYTITYTSTDKAGNAGTATRTVYVQHTAATTAGTYGVSDKCGAGAATTYVEVVTSGGTTGKRLNTTKFANYKNAVVYFDLSGSTGSTVTVPSQTLTLVGDPAANRQFSGTGTVSADGKTITINYTELTNGTTTTCTGTYVKP